MSQGSDFASIPRHELIATALQLGIERPDALTAEELTAAIQSHSEGQRAENKASWFSVARHLVASVVEQGLNLPGAAKVIRSVGGRVGAPPARTRPPLPTVTLAQIYLEQRHRDRARVTLEQVIERQPDNTKARSLLEQLDREEALAHSEEVEKESEPSEGAASSTPIGSSHVAAGESGPSDARQWVAGSAETNPSEGAVSAPAVSAPAVSAPAVLEAAASETAVPQTAALETAASEATAPDTGAHDEDGANAPAPVRREGSPSRPGARGRPGTESESDLAVQWHDGDQVRIAWRLAASSEQLIEDEGLELQVRTIVPAFPRPEVSEQRLALETPRGEQRLPRQRDAEMRTAIVDAHGTVLVVVPRFEVSSGGDVREVQDAFAPPSNGRAAELLRALR